MNTNINVVEIDDIKGKTFKNIKMIGAKAGQGKTQYAISEMLTSMSKNNFVGVISSEETVSQIQNRITSIINKQSELVDNKFAMMSINNSKLIINNAAFKADDNYIVFKMNEMNNEMNGLDFVLIDRLEWDNIAELLNMLNNINNEAIKLNTKVLMTFQLNVNDELPLN